MALDFAKRAGLTEIAQLIEAHDRANADAGTQGCYMGHAPALRVLLDHARANASSGRVLEAGARLDLRTHAGITALELAELYGYREIAELLREAMQRR